MDNISKFRYIFRLKTMNLDAIDILIEVEVTQLPQGLRNVVKQGSSTFFTQKELNEQIQYFKIKNNIKNGSVPLEMTKLINLIPGRMEEIVKIYNFIKMAGKGASTPLTVHGSTGCGKTSTILRIIQYIQNQHHNYVTVYANCLSILSIKKLYHLFLEKLFGITHRNPQHALDSLFKGQKGYFNPSANYRKIKLIVLDQIDQFINDKQFMYNILEWISLPTSKIILIFISNVVDLTEKFEVKLKSRMKSQSLIFKPYNFNQIKQIFHFKYPDCEKNFETSAISYICRKVANISSDIRLLQNIYQQVFDNKIKDKISIQDVQRSQIWSNPQLKKMLSSYQTLIKIVSRANRETDLVNELRHASFLSGKRPWSFQQVLDGLLNLQQMGFICIRGISDGQSNFIFSQYGIKVNDQLLLAADDQNY